MERRPSRMRKYYFILQVYDTWAKEQGYSGEYSVLEINKFGVSFLEIGNPDAPAEFEEVLRYCKKKNIKKLITANPLDLGIENNFDEHDGHSVDYDSLDEFCQEDFKTKGIDVEDADLRE